VDATLRVTEAEATIQTEDGPMPAHVALPDGTPRGGVVVFQEAFGVTSHIKDVTRRFARAGWEAVAPSLFHREGSPVFAHDDYEHAMGAMQTLTAGGITADVLAALDQFDSGGIPPRRSCVVGFCMGGSVAFYAATLRALGAAVTFYGGGVSKGRFGLPTLVDLAPSLTTPWLGLYGDRDQSIPAGDVELLGDAVARAPVATEIVRYPEAGHGFHNDERPDSYAREAARDAWSRALGWIERYAGSQDPLA